MSRQCRIPTASDLHQDSTISKDAKMFNSQELDAATDLNVQVVAENSGSAQPVMSDDPFPVFDKSLSYDKLTEVLTTFFSSRLNSKPISKNTLKNNWLNAEGRISRIYKNLQTPPLKTDSGRVTPFGIQAVFEFTQLVHLGSKHYDDYVVEIQSRYVVQPSSPTAEAKPVIEEEMETVTEAELVDDSEHGRLATFSETRQVAPLIQFNFQSLSVNLQTADTVPLNQQTQKAQDLTAQAAGVLEQAISTKFKADIAQVIAQNENLVASIQARAIMNTMQDLGLGKSTVPGSPAAG
jgi:hypothetical protein